MTVPADVRGEDTAASAVLGRKLVASLEFVRHGQHPNGEILSYRGDAEGNYLYCRTPFASTFVHDSLSCFDPGSPGWRQGALGLVPHQAAGWFQDTVEGLRRRIRRFVIWQQEPEGWWRFFGRASALDPDVNTTVAATVALQESYGTRSVARADRQPRTVRSFQSREGPYFTFVKPGQGGYGWLDEHGLPVVGFDRVVNAEVLRYLCRPPWADTAPATAVVEWLLGEIAHRDLQAGTPLYPNPLSFPYVLGRAHAESELPEARRFVAGLLPVVLALQEPAGGFGGPLSTAMGASALLDLGHRGDELERARWAVLRHMGPRGGWTYEDLVVHGFGSPAATTAASLGFLARYQCAAGVER